MTATPAQDRVLAYLREQVVYRDARAIARWAQCSPATVRTVLARLTAQDRIKTTAQPPPQAGAGAAPSVTSYLLIKDPP
jgi:hypothetical protein